MTHSPAFAGGFLVCLLPVQSVTSTTFTLPQNDLNWLNLSQETRDYFHHLAAGDPDRNGQEFYEDTVPEDLQDKPELVTKYLNGDPELGVSDKDWSHDVSRANGGSDSADNGRFEDASVNRSRGAENTTPEEEYAAELDSEEDTQTLLASVEEVTQVTLWAEAAEFASGAAELSLDLLAPVVGGGFAAKKVADQFEQPKDKWGWGSLAGGATALFLTTPVGQACVAGYVGYRVVRRGHRLYVKHFAAA